MYALSLGVQHIHNVLPSPVYGLLSGMNSATVGIIALAAVQLAEKAIKDKFSRILVIFGACAGMCYSKLWYFPMLMVIGGTAAVIWHGWMSGRIRRLKANLKRRRSSPDVHVEEASATNTVPLEVRAVDNHGIQRRIVTDANSSGSRNSEPTTRYPSIERDQRLQSQQNSDHIIRVRVGIAIVVLFFGMCSFYVLNVECYIRSLIYLHSLLHWDSCWPWRESCATHRS